MCAAVTTFDAVAVVQPSLDTWAITWPMCMARALFKPDLAAVNLLAAAAAAIDADSVAVNAVAATADAAASIAVNAAIPQRLLPHFALHFLAGCEGDLCSHQA